MLLRALLLSIATAIAALPVMGLPGLDGTEGRRVQISLEMAASGDWLVPSLGHEPTWAKPPLHYWLLGLCNHWFGTSVWELRLPGVLAAFVAAFVAGELLRRWFGPRAGWLGALGIAASPLVLFEWPTAEIDPVFATFTAVSLWFLATGVARERRGLVVAAGVVGGLAILTKGPPYFVFALGAWLVWWRHRRGRGFVAYIVPMLVVVLAYYVPVWLARTAPAEMLSVANEESWGRAAYFTWHDVQTIPLFWLRAIAIQLPFLLWCFWEWRGARDARMDGNDLTLRMCSGAAVVAVVLLTLFPGRPTRYLLPNVLLFTFAVTPAVAHFAAFTGPVPRFARRVFAGVGVLGASALCVLPFVPQVGVGALGLAAIAAVGPLCCRTPLHVVLGCILLPFVAAWTIGVDRSLTWHDGPRARQRLAAVLTRELVARGVVDSELQTFRHFDSPLLLAMGLLPPGDENGRRPWQARWVLHEVATPPIVVPRHYTTRVRIDAPFKSFALCERVGEAR